MQAKENHSPPEEYNMKNYKTFYLNQINSLWRPLFNDYKSKLDRDLQKLIMDSQRYIRIMPKNIQESQQIAEYIAEKIKEEFTIPRRMGDQNQIALDANMESLLPKFKIAIIHFYKNLKEYSDIKHETQFRSLFREAFSYCMGITKLYLFSTLKI
jgi:hypothetical protein